MIVIILVQFFSCFVLQCVCLHIWTDVMHQSVLYHSKKCIVNVTLCFRTFRLVILIPCWKVQANISCDHFFKIMSDTINFFSCKSWFNFWAIFLKFLLFWHYVIFINFNKCFSCRFVAMFCTGLCVLSTHHRDSDAD